MNSLKTISFLITTAMLFTNHSFSQEPITVDSSKKESKNIVYIEAGGAGIFYSLNYERVLLGNKRIKPTVRFGLEYIFSEDLFLPISCNIIFGKGKHKTELGAGVLLILDFRFNARKGVAKDDPLYSNGLETFYNNIFNGFIGYRHENYQKKIIIRIGYSPFYDPIGYHHWGGFSVGYKL
jgi:hypothetical protein